MALNNTTWTYNSAYGAATTLGSTTTTLGSTSVTLLGYPVGTHYYDNNNETTWTQV